VENEDIADVFNTVLKMGKKRAFVDAVLSATAASDIFTQDIEEMKQKPAAVVPEEPPREDIARMHDEIVAKARQDSVVVEPVDTPMSQLKSRLHEITSNPEDASRVCEYVSGLRLEEVKTQDDATTVLSGMDSANADGLPDETILSSSVNNDDEPIPF
jgi:hypothetical protein